MNGIFEGIPRTFRTEGNREAGIAFGEWTWSSTGSERLTVTYLFPILSPKSAHVTLRMLPCLALPIDGC